MDWFEDNSQLLSLPQVQDVIGQQQSHWDLTNRKFTTLWRRVFEVLQRCDAEELWLDQNQEENIICSLQNMSFPNLKFLCISYNKITSVQNLSKISFPFLQQLILDSNLICNIRSVRKWSMPSLQFISITDNPILEPQKIAQLSCSLLRIDLEYTDSNVIGGSLNWLTKIKTPIEKIYIEAERRIQNNRISQMLLKKFVSMEIYAHQNM